MRIAVFTSLVTSLVAVVALMFIHAPTALGQNSFSLSGSPSLSGGSVAFVLPHEIESCESCFRPFSGPVNLTVFVRSSQTVAPISAGTPTGWVAFTPGETRILRVDSSGNITEIPNTESYEQGVRDLDREIERFEQIQLELARRMKQQREEIDRAVRELMNPALQITVSLDTSSPANLFSSSVVITRSLLPGSVPTEFPPILLANSLFINSEQASQSPLKTQKLLSFSTPTTQTGDRCLQVTGSPNGSANGSTVSTAATPVTGCSRPTAIGTLRKEKECVLTTA